MTLQRWLADYFLSHQLVYMAEVGALHSLASSLYDLTEVGHDNPPRSKKTDIVEVSG